MIVNAVIRFFKAFFGFIVKAAAWLLFAFGLWLPCLYAVIFLIVCALSATSFNTVLPRFFVGLALSFVVGVALSYYIDKAKRKRKRAVKRGLKDTRVRRMEKEPKRKEIDDDRLEGISYAENKDFRDVSDYADEYESRSYGDCDSRLSEYEDCKSARYEDRVFYEPSEENEQRVAQESQGDSLIKPASDKPVYDFRAEAELRGKIFEDEKKSRLAANGGYDYEASARRRLEKLTYAEDEPPMVFRSRADKSIYIYEYADRLEYYERTAWGEMKLIDVRYKRSF